MRDICRLRRVENSLSDIIKTTGYVKMATQNLHRRVFEDLLNVFVPCIRGSYEPNEGLLVQHSELVHGAKKGPYLPEGKPPHVCA